MRDTESCVVLNKGLCLHILVRAEKQRKMLKEAKLLDVLESASENVARVLPLRDMDILFELSTDVIPETGDWGYTESKSVVRLRVDPAHKDGLKSIIKSQLPKTLAHELYHAVRMAKVGYGKTLLEAMVNEGLADQFADSLYPKPKSPWTDALTQKEQEKWWKIAKKNLNKGYKHSEWFWGAGKIPRWTGYTIGYRLVGDAIKRLEKPPGALIGALAKEIFRVARAK